METITKEMTSNNNDVTKIDTGKGKGEGRGEGREGKGKGNGKEGRSIVVGLIIRDYALCCKDRTYPSHTDEGQCSCP